MKINLRRSISALALAVGLGISLGAVQAQDPDYSKNRRYQQGMHEGQYDQAHHLDHSKKRHFKKDEDQRAYEAGYQKAHGN